MKKLSFVLVMLAASLPTLYGQTSAKQIEPKGVYKEIDVARHNKAVEILQGDNKMLKQQTVDSILKNPNYYNPPVLYALSRELFKQDKKDKAAFWFYVAQLRARYDANLCLDATAREVTSVLTSTYGPEINKYAGQNLDSLEKTVTKVVEFVKSNDENYDHRWINLHGMDAVMAGMEEKTTEKRELSEPKDKWPAIKKKTIDDYFDGFIRFVKSRK